jgi:type I site-specific restriction endonuclease
VESPDLNERYDQQHRQYQHHVVTHVCRSFHRDRSRGLTWGSSMVK